MSRLFGGIDQLSIGNVFDEGRHGPCEASVELNGRRRGRGRRADRGASIAGRTYLTLAIISFCFVAELIIQ